MYVVILPAVEGLFSGLLISHFAREARGHGVPDVTEAVALKGGRIRPIVGLIISLASSLSIGSGGSVGREGPIVQIGSALGSSIGKIFILSDDRIRNLVARGAAGGIAATFNTPITLEADYGDFQPTATTILKNIQMGSLWSAKRLWPVLRTGCAAEVELQHSRGTHIRKHGAAQDWAGGWLVIWDVATNSEGDYHFIGDC